MPRKMTAAEAEAFDGCQDHSNSGGSHHCCPQCLESSEVDGREPYDDPNVVKCPRCGTEFLAWTAEVPVAFSARLPATADVD